MQIVETWQEVLEQTYNEFLLSLSVYLPKLIVVLLLLIVGWLIAVILASITNKIVYSFDGLFQFLIRNDPDKKDKIRKHYSHAFSSLIFWLVLIFFAVASTNLLGWNLFTKWVDQIVTHFPSLITGILIIITGIFVANIAKSAIITTTKIEGAKLLASITQLIILFTVIAIGIEQIGINIDFLTSILTVLLSIFLAGGVLAFGLGAKSLVSNLIASQYLGKYYNIGEHIKLGDLEGKIIEITQTSLIVDTEQGRARIPANHLNEQVSIVK